MQNNKPYITAGTMPCIADKLLIPLIGVNAFYTAHSNISKMVSSKLHLSDIVRFVNGLQIFYCHVTISVQVLVDDDWINRAILELAETENIVVEGAGATSLAAILAVPTVLPELQGKTYVLVFKNILRIKIALC